MSVTGLTRTSDPTAEPITTAEARAQCRLNHNAEDALLDSYIKAARVAAEDYCERSFVTQEWKVTLSAFPDAHRCRHGFPDASRCRRGRHDAIDLLRPPVQSVEQVQYIDANGAYQTIDLLAVMFFAEQEPSQLIPYPGTLWPKPTLECPGAVSVTYLAGYGDHASDVPEPIRQAIREMVQLKYDRAPTMLTESIKELLAPFKIFRCV